MLLCSLHFGEFFVGETANYHLPTPVYLCAGCVQQLCTFHFLVLQCVEVLCSVKPNALYGSLLGENPKNSIWFRYCNNVHFLDTTKEKYIVNQTLHNISNFSKYLQLS